MRILRLLFAMAPALGGCGSTGPIDEQDAGAIVDCNVDKGPVDSAPDPDAWTKACKPGQICILSQSTEWVCANNVTIECNSEKGQVAFGPDPEAGTYECPAGYFCFDATDGAGWRCFPPKSP